jgi:hypothetical protein
MGKADEQKPRVIKLVVPPRDHARIRIAAALEETNIADFCRRVVLAEATRRVGNLDLPALRKSNSRD